MVQIGSDGLTFPSVFLWTVAARVDTASSWSSIINTSATRDVTCAGLRLPMFMVVVEIPSSAPSLNCNVRGCELWRYLGECKNEFILCDQIWLYCTRHSMTHSLGDFILSVRSRYKNRWYVSVQRDPREHLQRCSVTPLKRTFA